jgi:sulfatase modifying factor 1
VGAYKRFASATKQPMPTAPNSNPGWRNDSLPMVKVTHAEAAKFCSWAGGKMPTEAEWDYAARAGLKEATYGSANEVSWNSENSATTNGKPPGPHPVAQKRPNAYGLFDMLGNVSEWVSDFFTTFDRFYFPDKVYIDPPGPSTTFAGDPSPNGPEYAVRGGSWRNLAWDMRLAWRVRANASYAEDFLGFRCASAGF